MSKIMAQKVISIYHSANCKHRKMKEACAICEREDTIAELRRELAKLRIENAQQERAIDYLISGVERIRDLEITEEDAEEMEAEWYFRGAATVLLEEIPGDH